MAKLRVESFTVSLDGYGAGPSQSLATPLGRGGENLHGWLLPTQTFARVILKASGTTGVDNDIAARGFNHGLDLNALGYQCVEHVPTQAATHVSFRNER